MNLVEELRAALPTFKYSDYLKSLGALERAGVGTRRLRIAVLRSYTIETIEPVLRLRLMLEGFNPEIYFGGYNQYVQEILDPSSGLYEFRPDIVLLMVRIEELLPEFVEDFGVQSEWDLRMAAKARELGDLVATIQARVAAQVIVQNASIPAGAYWGVFDAQMPAGQTYAVGHFNRTLAEVLAPMSGAFVWDFRRFVENKGYDQIFDSKMWFFSKNPYQQSAYPGLVGDLMRYLLSALGKAKKCVVLDLDNTLWGGVIGEDGMEGIRLGHTYPGNCFREFQKELLKLHRRGIILAINSKNNAADALEVLDKHPDMVLRREHFSAMQINWNDKVTNLKAIAADLNIGVDSMIMIDDNPAECEQIRRLLPACDVVCLPEKPYLIPEVVRRLPGTENVRLTDEDKKKGAMYQAQIARKELQNTFANVDEFLADLGVAVSIEPATAFSVPRIAQLTQKTNQLNVTTRRYTEAEISRLNQRPDTFVFSVSSSDKFGDNGIVGVFILRIEGADCSIDTLLLSCRVIGRNIEATMLRFMEDFAREKGARTLYGEFVPTAKNAPAAKIFESCGFEKLTDTLFKADLETHAVPVPAYIQVAVKSR